MGKLIIALSAILSLSACGGSFNKASSITVVDSLFNQNQIVFNQGQSIFRQKCLGYADRCKAAGDNVCKIGRKCLEHYNTFVQISVSIDTFVLAAKKAVVISDEKELNKIMLKVAEGLLQMRTLIEKVINLGKELEPVKPADPVAGVEA